MRARGGERTSARARTNDALFMCMFKSMSSIVFLPFHTCGLVMPSCPSACRCAFWPLRLTDARTANPASCSTRASERGRRGQSVRAVPPATRAAHGPAPAEPRPAPLTALITERATIVRAAPLAATAAPGPCDSRSRCGRCGRGAAAVRAAQGAQCARARRLRTTSPPPRRCSRRRRRRRRSSSSSSLRSSSLRSSSLRSSSLRSRRLGSSPQRLGSSPQRLGSSSTSLGSQRSSSSTVVGGAAVPCIAGAQSRHGAVRRLQRAGARKARFARRRRREQVACRCAATRR
jgi:hypothetical protein